MPLDIRDLPQNLKTRWQQCGWHEMRRVDPGEFLGAMTKLGGTPLPAGLAVLQSVHGLSLGDDDWGWRFDLPLLLGLIFETTVEDIQDRLQMQLCPLGVRLADMASLYMNEQQRFIVLDEGWTVFFRCTSLMDVCYWITGDQRAQFTMHTVPPGLPASP